ncbi:MarR family winged helix-turn-helix transcriptional regulator [Prescottella subtropica]|uniref:MarR family winged helix-turn-helix transcriptional regulator n=1 Tax=Prescottella subtropica TaxID=2545757 RepID=UPI0010F44DCE|nr:MarR family transcriptional regulator [Prescottella subtropica]
MAVHADTAQALVDAIFLFGRSLRAAVANTAGDPVAPALVAVLVALSVRGSCRQNELASMLCLSQSALSRQLTELVDAGLVERRPDPDDRRAFRVHVTEQGTEVLRTTKARRSAHLRGQLTDWSQEDASAALTLIERLTVSLTPRPESAPLTADHCGSTTR